MLRSREFYSSNFNRFKISGGQLSLSDRVSRVEDQRIRQICTNGVGELERATNVFGQTSRAFKSEYLVAKLIRGSSNDEAIRDKWSANEQKRFAPSKQIAIVREACRRYWERFGKELPVEEMLGFFIADCGEKYTFHPKYQVEWAGAKSGNDYRSLAAELVSVDVHIGESYNHISTPEGLVLIDTEFWHLANPEKCTDWCLFNMKCEQ